MKIFGSLILSLALSRMHNACNGLIDCHDDTAKQLPKWRRPSPIVMAAFKKNFCHRRRNPLLLVWPDTE